ncbi:MAG: hypothetical protein RID07_00155, partial [Lacipirellulaceae bacterium]
EEKVKESYYASAPRLSVNKSVESYALLQLEQLLTMKLTSFRRKDQVHVQDLIGVGFVDDSWKERLQPELADRLQELLDDPEG